MTQNRIDPQPKLWFIKRGIRNGPVDDRTWQPGEENAKVP